MVPDARIDREIARGEPGSGKQPMPKPIHLTDLGLRAAAALVTSDGGSTSYYELPPHATELNDLIEHKGMSFALGNIFKACYRFGEKDAASRMYDLNKIIYFAERLKALETRRKRSQ
ncbi:hypothetical protein NJB95_07685 [Brucella intermedia]|uniref:hypothetical protein n=1 Tax=Brucella intermedia TaxID=94625 RepID=UPI00209B1048|nr:hypothetical protein [Brucella intermedia]MCO7736492.1 hypothetical protein [Brucella intermedia]WLF99166.1 hypothetical protein Q5698_15750 [Brucella intermedia]